MLGLSVELGETQALLSYGSSNVQHKHSMLVLCLYVKYMYKNLSIVIEVYIDWGRLKIWFTRIDEGYLDGW